MRAHWMKVSSGGDSFSSPELWWFLIGGAVAEQEKIFVPPAGIVRYASSCWGLQVSRVWQPPFLASWLHFKWGFHCLIPHFPPSDQDFSLKVSLITRVDSSVSLPTRKDLYWASCPEGKHRAVGNLRPRLSNTEGWEGEPTGISNLKVCILSRSYILEIILASLYWVSFLQSFDRQQVQNFKIMIHRIIKGNMTIPNCMVVLKPWSWAWR